MTVIGVVSDTHIPVRAKKLPEILLEGFAGVDLIIHAGDMSSDYVLYELEEIALIHAVAGNTDNDYVQDKLGKKKIITVDGCKIGIIHGDGTGGTTLERVRKAFQGDSVNCVVFGHSHIPFNEVIDDILYFNPGSPTDKRRQEYYSYGILDVVGNRISGTIKKFKKCQV